ncbi:MAG: hypothetical protein QOJ46_2778 [bacterium]|jgi:hypothetical protein
MRRAAALVLLIGLVTTGCAPAVPAATSASPLATAAANKQLAGAEADRLLALAQVPPDATELKAPPAGLPGPILGTPATSSLIDKARYWHVGMAFTEALAWVKAHPPAGLTESGTADGSGANGLSGGVSYSAAASPAWTNAALEIGVAEGSNGTSDLRADGLTEWLDAVPMVDDVPGDRLRVEVAAGCPTSDSGDVGVIGEAAGLGATLLPEGAPAAGLVCVFSGLNGTARTLMRSVPLGASAAAALASAVTSSALAHLDDVVTSCPMDDGSVTVFAFSYAKGPDVDIWYARTGCQRVANGRIAAPPSESLREQAAAFVPRGVAVTPGQGPTPSEARPVRTG